MGESDTDFCTGNNPTPNFRLDNIDLAANLVAPAGGSPGALGVSAFDMLSGDSGDHSIPDQSLSEVGVFTITATPPAYFGETIAPSTSANIGRFYPDHFTLVSPALENRSMSGCAALPAPQPVFTYMDELFTVSYNLEARNAAGGMTRNYTGGFAKLPITGASMVYGAADSAAPTDLTARLVETSTSGGWTDGVATVSSNLGVSKAASVVEDGPFNQFDIGIKPQDSDGIVMGILNLDTDNDSVADHALLGTTSIRYGRLYIGTGLGSELLPITVPLEVQYFNGTAFIPNTDDNCTTIDDIAGDGAPDLILSNDVEASPQTDGDILVCPAHSTTLSLANNPVVLGLGKLSFSAPGKGCSGYSNISVDLGTTSPPGQNKPWLQYDWSIDGTNTNPTGRVDFGVFEGQNQLIYTREPWN